MPTQDVSGAARSERNNTITAWAEGDEGETECPTPGMLMMGWSILAAAAFARKGRRAYGSCQRWGASDVLGTGWCMASGAAITFQTSRQSSLKYAQPPTPSSCIDAG